MNKTLIAGMVGIVLLAAFVIGVQAYGPQARQNTDSTATTCQYHDRMQQVLETGTYADLVKLREESGRPMMPFVTNEETFQQAKDRHMQVGANAKTGCGRMGTGQGRGQMHNCPLNE